MLESLYRILFLFALLFLAFLFGAWVTEEKVFPYGHLKQAYEGARALFVQKTEYRNLFHHDVWQRSRYGERGVRRHVSERAFDGLTLYTSSHAPQAYLIDMAGQVVHTWSLPFSRVWEDPPHIARPRGDEFVFWRKAWLYPNGDLLVVYVAQGDTPWGYGLVKLNRDSELLWAHPARIHHDVTVAPDGKIYTLSHEVLLQPLPDLQRIGIEPPYLDDSIEVLSSNGELLKKVSIGRALARSKFANLFKRLKAWQLLHTNTVKWVDEDTAARFPFLKAGNVLVSARDLDALLAVDLEREEVTWALTGGWKGQHDPDLLDNGHILLFDNWGGFGPGGRSRVLEIDPMNGALTWSYEGTPEGPFDSWQRGAQQRLPNGNTLVTESVAGRLLEITAGGEIVWEFVNPVRAGEQGQLTPYVMWGQRFHRKELTFLAGDETAVAEAVDN
jgi:hypothetical protein